MIKHSSSFRKWVNRIAIISLTLGTTTVAIIFFSLYQQKLNDQVSCKEWLEETISPLEFEVEVLEIDEVDPEKCHFELELSIGTPDYLRVCQCPGKDNFISQVEKGDSIFKKSEERTLYVKKKGGKPQAFAYPCCE